MANLGCIPLPCLFGRTVQAKWIYHQWYFSGELVLLPTYQSKKQEPEKDRLPFGCSRITKPFFGCSPLSRGAFLE